MGGEEEAEWDKKNGQTKKFQEAYFFSCCTLSVSYSIQRHDVEVDP